MDLSLNSRPPYEIHPAILFTLDKIKENIVNADDQRIFIMLPTGWDSHDDETAPCGKLINNRMMSQ